ncbi:MAG: hypothetical protein RH859_03975 [Longimicrobiales bacterium]
MPNRTRRFAQLAPVAAVIGLAVATASAPTPEAQVALPLLGVGMILLTLFLFRIQQDAEGARFLLSVVLWAVAARFLIYGLIQQSMGPYVFAPDALTYEAVSADIVRAWTEGAPLPPRALDSLQVGYYYYVAVFNLLLGEPSSGPVAVNIFLSAWTAVPIYYAAYLVANQHRGVAETAAILVAFFPSLILWSTLNIREAPAVILIGFTLLLFVRFQLKGKPWDAVGVIVLLALLLTIREYIAFLVGISATAGTLIGKSRSPVRALFLGSGMLVGVTFVLQNASELGGSLTEDPSLERVQYLRRDLATGAGSAYGEGFDVSTPQGALVFLPVGLAYFLFAPFPWAIGSALQAVTIPETLIWYTLVPFGVWGMILAVRHDARSYTTLLTCLVTLTFAYALVEGNVGTAYRHRAQILPFVLIFCALGLRDAWGVYRLRRDRARRQRRSAAARLGEIRPERVRASGSSSES